MYLPETYFGVDEAAAYLDVKPSTIRRWIHQRIIPFRRHGGTIAFCKRDLDSWSDSSKCEPKKDFEESRNK